MVIMERAAHHQPVDREIFQKQLDVAVAQFGLVYPCLLKDRIVDLYKLYCLVWEVKLKTNGDYSYTDNVEEWRKIAEELGYMGDINAIVLFKIYKRYISEGYEKSSSHLSGVPFSKTASFKSARDGASTPGSDVEMPRQKRVYRKRKDLDKSALNMSPSVTPVRLNSARYSVTPVKYNIGGNKTFSACTRPASPKVGGSRGRPRGVSPARGTRGVSPARGSRGSTPPVVFRNVESLERTALLRGIYDKSVVSEVSQLPAKETVDEEKIPDGCVIEGKGADAYIVDNGILPKPSGEPEKYDVNPVVRQLECGLPNEVQFGLNMLLWMTKSWALPLPKYPRLLSVLLANTGVLDTANDKFWEDDGMCEFWEETQQDSHFFNSGLQSQRTRAIQIGVILCNLCHIESNAKLLLQNDTFIRYLIQSLNSSCIPIRNSGVEILTILAKQVELENAQNFSSQVFQKLPSYLESSDRFLVISGLEVITNLCSIANNHAHLIDNLTSKQYLLFSHLLLVPDVQLLHAVLESMYSLTSIGPHSCEQFLSSPHLISTLVDLFSCYAERLEHGGVKVLRYVERKPTKPDLKEETKKIVVNPSPVNHVTTPEVRKVAPPPVQNPPKPAPVPVDLAEVKGPVAFAERWVKQNLQFSPGSILLKCAVYNKYVKAANAAGRQTDLVSPAELFTLLSNTFPGTFRQKISVGSTMKFVVKNMDWLKTPAQLNSVTTSSDSPAYFMKIKSIAPKTATSRPNTPITQFSTPKPPVSDTTPSTSSKVKLNPLPLSELADDAFKFVPDKKEETEEEVRSSEEEEEDLYKIKRKKRKRKKKELDEIIVAEIIVEELDHSDPKIIEECEDMDGRILAEEKDFPNSPEPARIIKTYSAKRENLTPRPNSVFNNFNQQQPRQYSQYKKTLMLDLSTTPEKKQRMEQNAAKANSFARPTSPEFNSNSSPTFDRTNEQAVSPTFDNQNDSLKDCSKSPTFDRCSSPVFDCSEPSFKKSKLSEPGSPTFEKAGSPTFDKPESPTFEKARSPTFDKPGSPTFEKARSPTFDKPGSPTFEKPGSPTFEKPGSPTFEKQGSPTFEKPGSPTFKKPGSPTFDKPGSPTFDKPRSPTFEKPELPTVEKPGSPTFEKTGSPTFRKDQPTLKKKSSPIFEDNQDKSPIFENDGFSSSDKKGSPTAEILASADQHEAQNQAQSQNSLPVTTSSQKSVSEVVDHLNSVTSSNSMLDDPACTFSPLPSFEPDSSIFDRNSDNSAGKSNKLKIDNDIFVSEAEVDSLTSISLKKTTPVYSSCSKIQSSPSCQRKVLVSPVPDSRKNVLKTVVSNHQSGEMSTVSLIPISISGHINSRPVPQISSGIQTMTPDSRISNSSVGTVRLAKISPQKSNPGQFVNQSSQIQVLAPSQQQNVMVVNQQPGSSQQVYVMPSPQQRLIMSPPSSSTQQVLVLPQSQLPNSQPIFIASQNQTQQVFVSQSPQQSNMAGQPILIATSGTNSGQPIIIAQHNQSPQTAQVILTSQSQTTTGPQFILAPQPQTNTGQIILSPNNSAGSQPVLITQQPASNGPVLVQTPNSQVQGQILLAPQNQVPQNPVLISPPSSTRVLVLPQSQQTNNQVLLASQQGSQNTVQQFVIGTQTSPPSSSEQMMLSPAPVFLNSSSNPVIISQSGSPTKQILVPLSASSFPAARISQSHLTSHSSVSSNVTSHSSVSSNVTSHSTSLTTSCTTVYSEPVVCTTPGRYTFTLSPSKMPVMSPIKVTHISPIKFMSNGNGGAVALVSGSQPRVGSATPQTTQVSGSKRPLTRIAPRPTPYNTTCVSSIIPAALSTTVEPSICTSTTTSSNQTVDPPPSVQTDRKRKLVLPHSKHTYPCHWKNCTGGFEKEVDLRNHLLSKHVSESPSACLWVTCSESPGARSTYSLIFHLKNIHARAPLLTHIPSSNYTREKVRLLLSRTLPWTDPRETPITKSLHLLTALIIRNLIYFTPELVGDVSRFETVFATIAMSSQEAGKVLTDVLALTSGITEEAEEDVFITHLPPFR